MTLMLFSLAYPGVAMLTLFRSVSILVAMGSEKCLRCLQSMGAKTALRH